MICGEELAASCASVAQEFPSGSIPEDRSWSEGLAASYQRAFLWALAMGPFDSGGVCSMGPYSVYGI